MTHKQPKPPTTQRRFASIWIELDYVCKKIRYWLYSRKRKSNAARYTNRLARVLRELPKNNMAILREEALALLYQLKGDLDKAIVHREREIQLMDRLQREARAPRYGENTRAYMLQGRTMIDLQERRGIFEALKKEAMNRTTFAV